MLSKDFDDQLETKLVRILMIAPQPFYEDRGTPIVLRRVLQAISECGHQVDLITFPSGDPVTISGLRIIRIGKFLPIRRIPIGLSINKFILDMFLFPAVIRQLRKERYDCMHAVEEAAFPALLAARIRQLPLLYDMQSCLPEQLRAYRFFRSAPVQRVLQRCESMLLRRVDMVACSVGLKDHVQQVSPETAVREWHYPSGDGVLPITSTEHLKSDLNIPSDGFIILYTGNFAAYQGVDRLVNAIPLVLEEIPNAIFVFVGAEESHTLPGMAENGPSKPAVRVIPRQPQEQIQSFLSVADVVVSPRDSTGNLPLKVLDYMASRKPIVATSSPAHRKVLNNDSAVLVEYDPAAIAAGIVTLYKNPELAKRLAEAAHKFAMDNLGWNVFISQVENLYRTLAHADSRKQ